MVTYLILGGACAVSGVLSGMLLTLIYSATVVSRSQERMQRKIRQAWNETRSYRERHGNQAWEEEPDNRWETWL